MKADWDKRFLEMTDLVGNWSKDIHKKCGCVIVDESHRVISVGYNGFPSGCDDSVLSRYERPTKYDYTEHAERNAIYSAAKNGTSVNNCIMYISLFPCVECTRAIIQSGVKKLICPEPDLNHERWGKSFKISLELLNEVGIELKLLKK
jgi:dCMP deaminase